MRRLYRSRRDSKIFGVCGGLADLLNVDPTLLRVIVIVTTFLSGGTVIPIYILAALVIPKEPAYPDPGAGGFGYGFGGAGAGAACGGPGGYAGYGAPEAAGCGSRRSYGGGAPQGAAGYGAAAPQASDLDDMMKDIEKKAMQRELEELRAKVARFEEVLNAKNKSDHPKGDE